MKTIGELSERKSCAIYNELGHMTPYYLTVDFDQQVDEESELLFHKRNIYLLALTFHHVLICTDNLSAFTSYIPAAIVSKVIVSDWFRKLLDAGVIVLCGWGSNYGPDLMENQIEYSMGYRPNLKKPSFVAQLRDIAHRSEIVLREPGYGELDHVLFLRDKIGYLEGQFTRDEVSFLSDLVEDTQERHGYVGTIEMFPVIEQKFPDLNKANAFYRAYFRSWQEYCTAYYTPAITVDSSRIRLPGRKTTLKRFAGDVEILSSLFSPDFFSAFLGSQFGPKAVTELLNAHPERLIAIRNGDWKIFLDRYHDCLESASKMAWIMAAAHDTGLLSDEKRLANIVDDLFKVLDPNTDFLAIVSLLEVILKTVPWTSFVGPTLRAFKVQINRRLLAMVNRAAYSEFQPFLKKLNASLLHHAVRPRLAIP